MNAGSDGWLGHPFVCGVCYLVVMHFARQVALRAYCMIVLRVRARILSVVSAGFEGMKKPSWFRARLEKLKRVLCGV